MKAEGRGVIHSAFCLLPSDFVHNLRSPAALARFFLTCAVGLAIDLSTKVYAANRLLIDPVYRRPDGRVEAPSDEYTFIPGWLHFHFTANQGAVFGIGQGQRTLFILVSLAAIVFLTYLFAASGKQRFYQVILGMLLAGVLGNMYDRIAFGYVRDMIYALPGWHWPGWFHTFLPMLPAEVFPWIFNVADMLLCTGVFLMIVNSAFAKHPRHAVTQTNHGDAAVPESR
jgi:lipoprotein signal peptidase